MKYDSEHSAHWAYPRVFIFLLLLLPVYPARAEQVLNVVINEIAWMGTEVSYNDEWIELYNITENNINLDGWVLKADDGTPEIKLTGLILANSFFLLERVADETVPGISADLIYKGALGNNGEILKLFDSAGSLIDEVNCSSSWPAGDNKTKQTMERREDNAWQTSVEPGGTPKGKNSKQGTMSSEQKTEQPEKVETGFLQVKPVSYPSDVLFNEILPSPEGADELEEWIELKNLNAQEVDLSQWKIQDTTGSIITYTFLKETKIGAKGFLVLFRPATKITLNNDGDGLKIIQPNGNVLDTVTYQKAPRGQSYNHTDTGWVWSTILTPGLENIILLSSSEAEPTRLDEENSEESASSKKSPEAQKPLAAISEKIPKSPESLRIFLIALGLAIFSGIIVFLLKRNFGTEKNV